MTRETPDSFAQSASALTPALSLQNCLCSPMESQYASNLSLDMSIPMVAFTCLFLTLSCHAGLQPKYPFRSVEKTEATKLVHGPLRPRGERSNRNRAIGTACLTGGR